MYDDTRDYEHSQPNKKWKSGYVYVLDYGDGKIFKIGYTTQEPSDRLRQIVSTNVIMPMQFVFTAYIRSNALYVENLLHMTYDDFRRQGEWFELDMYDLVNIYQTLSLLKGRMKLYDHWYEVCRGWDKYYGEDAFLPHMPFFTQEQLEEDERRTAYAFAHAGELLEHSEVEK